MRTKIFIIGTSFELITTDHYQLVRFTLRPPHAFAWGTHTYTAGAAMRPEATHRGGMTNADEIAPLPQPASRPQHPAELQLGRWLTTATASSADTGRGWRHLLGQP